MGDNCGQFNSIRLYFLELLFSKPPKWTQSGPEPPKNYGIFQVKFRMAYRQTLKLGTDKLWKNAEAKGCDNFC